MNRNNSSQGMTYLNDNIIHVENALIEEVATDTGKRGYVLISFQAGDDNNMIYMQEVRLNVAEETIIIDEEGRPLNLYAFEEGMRIDADISAAMTRSIPPQSYAYRVKVLQNEIYVINKNGYIGESTKSEIEYAIKTGKEVDYLYQNNH